MSIFSNGVSLGLRLSMVVLLVACKGDADPPSTESKAKAGVPAEPVPSETEPVEHKAKRGDCKQVEAMPSAIASLLEPAKKTEMGMGSRSVRVDGDQAKHDSIKKALKAEGWKLMPTSSAPSMTLVKGSDVVELSRAMGQVRVDYRRQAHSYDDVIALPDDATKVEYVLIMGAVQFRSESATPESLAETYKKKGWKQLGDAPSFVFPPRAKQPTAQIDFIGAGPGVWTAALKIDCARR